MCEGDINLTNHPLGEVWHPAQVFGFANLMHMPEDVNSENVVDATKLTLEEWLNFLGNEKRDLVFPNNCFPTDEHKAEYLSQIDLIELPSLKQLARNFLNRSANYGISRDHFLRTIEKYGGRLFDDDFDSEFDRRSVPKNGPQWEGITWTLDLIPKQPQAAIDTISSYIQAHVGYFTDEMIYGHKDAIDIIRAKFGGHMNHSCFISYGSPDEKFASKLFASLQKRGIRAFFFPEHATPGKKLHRVMRSGVNEYDRIILICSEASLNRPGLLNELTETLQREAREGGKEYLIPIRLDDYVFDGWNPSDKGLAQSVRDRVVVDFSAIGEDSQAFARAIDKIEKTLKR
ncbi:MAG: toll/interleukin-1 receptor domain-containing protein [Planctomycetota bacterium]